MFRKMLLAYDNSPGADKALEVAIDLAKQYGAELWLLSVEDRLPHFAATIGEVDEEKEFEEQQLSAAQARALNRAVREGLQPHMHLAVGHVASTIVRFAQEGGFDVIVMGHTGRSGVWGNFLGTTAEKVSRHAPCTVIIVR